MTNQELSRQINESFNLTDLRGLMLDMGIEYENIAGDTRLEKIWGLIEYCKNNGRIEELIDTLSKLRPKLEWDIPQNSSDFSGEFSRRKNRRTILIALFFGAIVVLIIFLLIVNSTRNNLPASTPISEMITTIPSTATLSPTNTPTIDASIICNVEVGDLLLDKRVISADEKIAVTITVDNPDNASILYNWHSNYGQLNPGLRTPAMQSVYTPPLAPTDDVISLKVEIDGCQSIEREAKIRILQPSEITDTPIASIPPSATPTLSPTPTVTPAPTEIPMLMIESFENYTESLLREAFFVNTYAGNEGSLRLVGVPHTKDGVVALAFDYVIKILEPGKTTLVLSGYFPHKIGLITRHSVYG